MANRGTHMLVGGGVVLGLYFFYKKVVKKEVLSLEGVVGSFCLGTIAGALPDLLEPATNPNHRQFFHSVSIVALALLGRRKLYQVLQPDNQIQFNIDSFLLAYGSHLFLDFQTTKGLPII